MSCNLKLYIPLDKVNNINKELFKNYEISGIINFDKNNQVSEITKNKGEADSVYTPNNVINYHTHPKSAYEAGETIWGWPSGEDIRETLKFSLAGNKAHLVFTLEGIYTIQVSPCKIKKMKNLLNSEERGILIFLIEEYFKTTHNFRGTEEVKNLNNQNININPYSYVDFINNFDLSNLLTAKTIVHKNPKNSKNEYGIQFSRIPNIGFPELENNYITNIPMKDYISTEDLKTIIPINENGEEIYESKINNVFKKYKTILKKFNTNKCNSNWNNNPNSWFWVNFFRSNDKPYIKIFSNKTDGCSVDQIRKINKFSVINKNENTFGNGQITQQQRFLLLKLLFKYNNIEDLVSNINLYIDKHNLKLSHVTLEQVKNELSSYMY